MELQCLQRYHSCLLSFPDTTDISQGQHDVKLNDWVQMIELKYPVGLCPEHPDIRCFHYRPADNHFELTRTRMLVWANQIVSDPI